MRTVRTKVYKFDELTQTAKDKAINKYRNDGIDTDYIYNEAHNTVKAFHNIFPTEEDNRSWLDIRTSHIDVNILVLTGLRLHKYIINNYWNELHKGKYYNYKGNTPQKLVHKRIKSIFYPNRNYWGNYYYSAITLDQSCVLTGWCYDNSLLQPIYDFINDYKAKESYYSTMTFEDLLNDCFYSLKKDIDNEVEAINEDENIIEQIKDNEHEFTSNGIMI